MCFPGSRFQHARTWSDTSRSRRSILRAACPPRCRFCSRSASIGVVALFRRTYAPLRVLAVGGLIGGLGVVTIPFINERYLSDFMPLIVVTAAAGLYLVLGPDPVQTHRPGWVRVARRVLARGQLRARARCTSARTVRSRRRRAGRLRSLPARRTRRLVHVGAPRRHGCPRVPLPATLFVLGNCDAVYWSDGKAVASSSERRRPVATRAAHDPSAPRGHAERIVEAGVPGASDHVDVEHLAGDRIRFVYTSPHFPPKRPELRWPACRGRAGRDRLRHQPGPARRRRARPLGARICATGSRAHRSESWRPAPAKRD